ncbi:MAG: ABC transporter substrate-binding protein [Prevotella sp.]|nr:ABC transporter substrate-binding protein [Prevotella sp.]
MKYFFRCVLAFLILCAGVEVQAQNKWQKMHKVKRQETLFGIAKKYNLTINELVKANPDMNTPGYELKKGDYIFIPYPSEKVQGVASQQGKDVNVPAKATAGKVLNVGVMLPLHNDDGDGRRMVEYYRGLLMACDRLKKEGVSINMRAWNVPQDADMAAIVAKEGAARCDVIFGPLYTKQVGVLSDFARKNNIKLVIPFSISGNDVVLNSNIFQVYQSAETANTEIISQFISRFSSYHVVIIDCNDRTSDKGVFTFGLRKKLEERGIAYSITNLNSSDMMFAKAFSFSKPNVVILNTGRSPELNMAFNKLNTLKAGHSDYVISLFGYTEWLMYAKYNMDKFFAYDTYIPAYFYYNPLSAQTKAFENDYRRWFKSDMMDYMPRFAITGYDHGMYFLRGFYKHGTNFTGADRDKDALQTQMYFRRVGNGGLQNHGYMFVHYNRNRSISTINF